MKRIATYYSVVWNNMFYESLGKKKNNGKIEREMAHAECKKELAELFERLSEKISKIYDVEFAKEITEIFIDLTSRSAELVMKCEEESTRYWNLVKKLAKCEKERDKEQAEYDAEYYAKELVKYERMCLE